MSSLKENLLVEIVGGLTVALIIALSTAAYAQFNGQPNIFFSWGGAVFILAVTIFTFLALEVFRRCQKNPLQPFFEPIDVDFKVINKVISFEYLNAERTSIRYTKKITVQALQHGLEEYRDKYRWTGKGSVLITAPISRHTFVESGRKNIWQLYSIQFGKKLNKGDVEETILVFDLEDPEKKAVPFISADIDEPTDSLSIELRMPHGLRIQQVFLETSCNIGARKPYQTVTIPVYDGKVRWDSKRPDPKLLHHYEMTWVIPNQ